MSTTPSPASDNRSDKNAIVACLCADWCGTCREYLPLFAQLKARFQKTSFLWIDIEDQAELVDPIEVDNFPTVLVVVNGQARFFGTVLPHLETLQRLLSAQLDAQAPALLGLPDVEELVRRLLLPGTLEGLEL